MGAYKIEILKNRISEINEQLDLCNSINGKTRKLIELFFESASILSLDDVDYEARTAFVRYVDSMVGLTQNQRRNYRTTLDQAMVAYYRYTYPDLAAQIDEVINERPVRNRILLFLSENQIFSLEEIDYPIRKHLEDEVMGMSRKAEYIKGLDRLKLFSIKKTQIHKEVSSRDVVFLPYYPSYEIARSFYWVRNKEDLVFDFSIDYSEKLKTQILTVLNHILESMTDWHDRRERGILPLRKLYVFCIARGIEDVELMDEKQIVSFRESLSGTVGSKTEVYMQIINRAKRFLFVSSETTNWNSLRWYTERFKFKETNRMNPARIIEAFSFEKIRIEENRFVLMHYMKYQLGMGQKALSTINSRFGYIKDFLRYCDSHDYWISDVDELKMETYLYEISEKSTENNTYNRNVISIKLFYRFLSAKKLVDGDPCVFDRYLKTEYHTHHNRHVSKETICLILEKLHFLPEKLRLMTLILICTGIRVSELCTLKQSSIFEIDGTVWLKTYQIKTRLEKRIPIPAELFRYVEEYLLEKNINDPDDYIFKNTLGGAYCAGTYSKQMKRFFMDQDIPYLFKAHDFRHTVASVLDVIYSVPLQVVREFLGHESEEMTKEYVDDIELIVVKKNRDYFRKTK